MGNFIEILDQVQRFNEDINEDDLLNKFFGTLKRFNNNENMKESLKSQMEQYFNYRWIHDKNVAFEGEIAESINEQLGSNKELMNKFMRDYLHCDFTEQFQSHFQFNNYQS